MISSVIDTFCYPIFFQVYASANQGEYKINKIGLKTHAEQGSQQHCILR